MHTPGPWTACFAVAGPILDGALLGWHITAPEFGSSDPVCERRDGFDRSQRTDDEERANARLIAAAPELYEVLRAIKLIGHLANIPLHHFPPNPRHESKDVFCFPRHLLADLDAALSKVSQQQGTPQAPVAPDSEVQSNMNGSPADAYEAAFIRYIRTGDTKGLPEKVLGESELGYAIPEGWAALSDAAMAKRGARRGADDNTEVYANLAATATLLEDSIVNIREWLISESVEAFHATATEGARYDAGRILRDPYSAKPYVLFYYTRARAQGQQNEGAES